MTEARAFRDAAWIVAFVVIRTKENIMFVRPLINGSRVKDLNEESGESFFGSKEFEARALSCSAVGASIATIVSQALIATAISNSWMP